GGKLSGRSSHEWTAARRHFVENDAQRENVGAMVESAARELFRGHVGGRTHEDAYLRLSRGSESGVGGIGGAGFLCQTEVQNFDAAFFGDHDVRGLEVAMHDAFVGPCGQGGGG